MLNYLENYIRGFMKLKIFVVYHRDIHNELYDKESINKIVFIGVGNHIKKGYYRRKKYNIIYEKDFPIYDASLQEKGYCETSAIYHIYANKAYQDLDYIGFAQYDMYIKNDVFNKIDQTIVNDPSKNYIFYANKDKMLHLSNVVPYEFMINSYNAHFKTNFTTIKLKNDPLASNSLILESTFVIPVKIFEKIMPWISKFIDEIYPWANLPPWPTHRGPHGHLGGVIEMAYGIALYLEFRNNYNVTELIHIPIYDSPLHKKITREFTAKQRFLYKVKRIIQKFLDLTRPARGLFGLRLCQLRAFKTKLFSFLSK